MLFQHFGWDLTQLLNLKLLNWFLLKQRKLTVFTNLFAFGETTLANNKEH